MQSSLAKVSRKGGWGGLCSGAKEVKVGSRVRGWGYKGLRGSGVWESLSTFLLTERRWDLLSRGKSTVTPLASSANLSSAIDTI